MQHKVTSNTASWCFEWNKNNDQSAMTLLNFVHVPSGLNNAIGIFDYAYPWILRFKNWQLSGILSKKKRREVSIISKLVSYKNWYSQILMVLEMLLTKIHPFRVFHKVGMGLPWTTWHSASTQRFWYLTSTVGNLIPTLQSKRWNKNILTTFTCTW